RQRRGGVDHRGRGGRGRGGAAAAIVGGVGDDDADLAALVGLGRRIGRVGGTGDVAEAGAAAALPLVGQRVVGLVLGGIGGQDLTLLHRAGDRDGRQRRGGVDRRGRGGRGRGGAAAAIVGGVGDDDADILAL